MSPLTVRCIRAAFFYLLCGITLGVTFAVNRAVGGGLRMLHAELNLWGWVTLFIYGMSYHMLPRFTGRPLRSPALAELQSWLAILGVALASAGWFAQGRDVYGARLFLVGGGVIELVAALLFALLIGDLLRSRRA